MEKRDNAPETQPSFPPTRPPKPPVVAAGIDDSGSGSNAKPEYGCHHALWALEKRYRDSDIHGALSALIEQEQLLREHIGFPSYKFKLSVTMAMRSEVVFHLGDTQTAASIMADALSVMTDATLPGARQPPLARAVMLKLIRDMDKRANVKWRQNLID